MKLLKSAIVALTLALSLGTFSTTAVACTDGRTCVGNVEAIDLILGKVAEATRAIDDGDDVKTVTAHIKQAQKYSKEINANDVVDRARMKANGVLKKARKALKQDDMAGATELLRDAEKRFSALKGML